MKVRQGIESEQHNTRLANATPCGRSLGGDETGDKCNEDGFLTHVVPEFCSHDYGHYLQVHYLMVPPIAIQFTQALASLECLVPVPLAKLVRGAAVVKELRH